jgi:hypothetical protein
VLVDQSQNHVRFAVVLEIYVLTTVMPLINFVAGFAENVIRLLV